MSKKIEEHWDCLWCGKRRVTVLGDDGTDQQAALDEGWRIIIGFMDYCRQKRHPEPALFVCPDDRDVIRQRLEQSDFDSIVQGV